MDSETKQYLDRIYKAVAELRKSQHRETWVTASALCKLTGWDPNTLLMMRRNGVVQERKNGKKVRYLLESVPQIIFLKNQKSEAA
jgi:hypothetical protein